MTIYYLAFLVFLAAASVAVMRNCDFRDRVGMIGYLVLIALIDAFNRIGATEYIAAGILHLIFGATMVILSTRVVGVIMGVISFVIAMLVGAAWLGFIPTEVGQGVAWNIYHIGMSLQWAQAAVFMTLGAGWLKELDRDLA